LKEALRDDAREAVAQEHDHGGAAAKQREQGADRERGLVGANYARLVREIEDAEQDDGDDETEDVEEAQDAPREIDVREYGIAAGWWTLGLESFDGGHVARILPDAPRPIVRCLAFPLYAVSGLARPLAQTPILGEAGRLAPSAAATRAYTI